MHKEGKTLIRRDLMTRKCSIYVGHIFGKLNDEYVEDRGHYNGPNKNLRNLTASTKLEDQEDWWQELASYKKYYNELTNLHEGGDRYETGIYSTTYCAIMGSEYVDEFNSVSRFLIWSKIQGIIGNEFIDIKDEVKAFVEYDTVNHWIIDLMKEYN